MGLSDKPIEYLVAVARSWLNAAQIEVAGQRFASDGYSRDQRAYILHKNGADSPSALDFELQANEISPLVNPAFVIKNWGRHMCRVSINGSPATPGEDFRAGLRHRLEGTDLVVWVDLEATRPLKLSIAPRDPG